MTYKDKLLAPFMRTDGAIIGGDIVTGVPNTVPDRAPIAKADVPVVPAPTSPTTTRSDGTRIVGDTVAGMPQVDQNRGVPTPPAVAWDPNGAPADPTRQL